MEPFTTHNIISKDDYLRYYLYTVSTTAGFKKQRRRLRIFLLVFVLIAAVWSIVNVVKTTPNKLYIVVIAWIVIFPVIFWLYAKMEHKQYIRFFTKYIDTNHKENMIKGHDLEFENQQLVIKFIDHELPMPYKDLKEVYCNQNGIYIKNQNESSFIFPSSEVDYKKIKAFMKEIVKTYNIPYQEEEKWKWK